MQISPSLHDTLGEIENKFLIECIIAVNDILQGYNVNTINKDGTDPIVPFLFN